MTNINAKELKEQNVNEDVSSKAIRIDMKYFVMLTKGRDKVNEDSRYKKKISYSRYLEKLVEDHWQDVVEDLKCERESSEDWLKLEYKNSGSTLPFFDWLKQRYKGVSQKASKSNKVGEK